MTEPSSDPTTPHPADPNAVAPHDPKPPPPAAPKAKWWTRLMPCLGKGAGGSRRTSSIVAAADPNRPGDTASKFARQIRATTLTFAGFYAIACPALGFSLSTHWVREPFIITFAAVLIALAAACLGGLLGFIFAIPRELQSTQLDPDSKAARYIANTNLEQISDWLTKVIVGISLVQIGKLPAALGSLRRQLAPLLGSSEVGGSVGVVLCISAAVAAFLLGYLYTRVIILWLFAATGRDIEDYSKRRAQQSAVEATKAAVEASVKKVMGGTVSDDVRDNLLESIRSEVDRSAVTVDFSPLDPRLGATKVPVSEYTTVRDFLNFIYGLMPDWVPAFSYGNEWLLRRPLDDTVFRDIGTTWAQNTDRSSGTDDRPLARVGIKPGDSLLVIPGPAARSR